ncbi:MAG: acyl-CoA-binding protein [Chitinophagales bacterium]|nr:acyl-CoA-binding protein [Chitinophagales bacterium]MDW8273100.1 acyl-CoA-binding protein [Chitinophagales bacterium]
MSLKKKFEEAQQKIRTLTERPENEELLELYALYKQATEGDNNTKEPGFFDLKEKFKWNHWKSKSGMKKEEAMKAYVELVEQLLNKYSHT